MSGGRVLSARGSFVVAAAVVVLALWSSGSPAMVYPVYAVQWGLSPLVTTSVFAVYPVALVVVLVVFGSLSDHLGRRALLVAGVAVMAAGALVLAAAPSVGWLFVGRVVQGVGVGLAISPASALLVESSGGRPARASAVNTAATAVGTGVAILVGGALVQHAPWPTRLTFWVLVGVALCTVVVVWFLPRGAGDAQGRWEPRPVKVPRGIRAVFAVATLALVASFAMGAVFLSLGAQIAEDVIGTDDALLAAAVISPWALIIVVAARVARRLRPRTSIATGGAVSAVGLLLLLPAGSATSLPLFLASSLTSGTGYGLLFLGGLGLLNERAPAHQRAGVLSAAYLTAYLAQGSTAVLVGLTATRTSLATAVDVWAPLIGGLCALAGLVAALAARPPAGTAHPLRPHVVSRPATTVNES